MDEYIDKTAVIKAINEHFYKKFDKIAELGEGIESDFLAGIASTRKIVLDQPAVDAVEVVRCLDCRYCFEQAYRDAGYYCTELEIACLADGYCSYGEREEGKQ